MSPPPADKRSSLIQSASKLTHQRGFNRTTLAEIAADAGVPLGNVYYYFRTKEAIGEALIEQRVKGVRAQLETLDKHTDPKARLGAFVQMTVDNRRSLAKSGCPIGTLCTELNKDAGPLADQSTQLLDESLKWLEAQFRGLGRDEYDAKDLAAHVLSALQGASLLTHCLKDPSYVEREAKRLRGWILSVVKDAR